MNFPVRFAPIAMALALCGGVSACSMFGGTIEETEVDRNIANDGPQRVMADEPGLFDSLNVFGSDEGSAAGVQLPVNKYLWRGTLDTLSFLPMSSTDPYGGVIVTDWGPAPDVPGERYKVTAYITSAALKPQSLNVVVNRQTKSDNGGWVSAPVSTEMSRGIEDAILTRARQLRTADNKKEG